MKQLLNIIFIIGITFILYQLHSDDIFKFSKKIPKTPKIKIGGIIKFYGIYEWNAKGGVIHWTHHDPNGKHIQGYLKYKGKIYQ
jgi:hypothetical protein